VGRAIEYLQSIGVFVFISFVKCTSQTFWAISLPSFAAPKQVIKRRRHSLIGPLCLLAPPRYAVVGLGPLFFSLTSS